MPKVAIPRYVPKFKVIFGKKPKPKLKLCELPKQPKQH